jgi:predicted acyltransferase
MIIYPCQGYTTDLIMPYGIQSGSLVYSFGKLNSAVKAFTKKPVVSRITKFVFGHLLGHFVVMAILALVSLFNLKIMAVFASIIVGAALVRGAGISW